MEDMIFQKILHYKTLCIFKISFLNYTSLCMLYETATWQILASVSLYWEGEVFEGFLSGQIWK